MPEYERGSEPCDAVALSWVTPMRVILIASSIMVLGGYLWAAVVGILAGWRIRQFRRLYWVSVPMCLILAAYQVVRLAQGQTGDTFNLFARGAALAFIYTRTIRPVELFSGMVLRPRAPGSDPDP